MFRNKLHSLLIIISLLITSMDVHGQAITVTGVPILTVQQMVSNYLMGGNKDVTIKNINYRGGFGAIGVYDATATPFGTTQGLILSTGSIYKANGPFSFTADTNHTTWNYSLIPDYDAEVVANGGPPALVIPPATPPPPSTFDPAILEFDITTPGIGLKFNFQYGSDEYRDTLHSDTSQKVPRDFFAIFIQGKGIGDGLSYVNLGAITTHPSWADHPVDLPINSYTVNNGPKNSGPCSLCENYYDNTKGQYPFTNMPGFTGVFSRSVDVLPCDTYHVKLLITDMRDTFFDSHVFLNIETVSPPIYAVVDKYKIGTAEYPVDTVAFEECDYAEVRIERYTNIGAVGSVSLTYGGTAIPNVDYEALPGTVNFAPNQRTAILQLKAKKTGNSNRTVIVNNSNEICGTMRYYAKTYYIKKDLLSFNLGPDTALCEGSKLVLNATNNPPAEYYVWQDAKSGPYYTVTKTGLYSVRERIGTCLKSDTISVYFKPLVKFNLGPDSAICEKQSLKLDPKLPLSDTTIHYQWFDNSITPTNTVKTNGDFWLKVTKYGCSSFDTVKVTVKVLPFVNAGNDTTFCYKGSPNYNIVANSDPLNTFLWSTGATTQTINVKQNGNYWVKVKGNGCFNYDTVKVTMNQTPPLNIRDTLLCENYSLKLKAPPGFTYLWSTGSFDSSITVTTAGTFSVIARNGACVAYDTSVVTRKPTPHINLGNDSTLCKGETLFLDATYTADAVSYKWSGAGNGCGTNNQCTATSTGNYIVKVTSQTNGCAFTDTLYFYAKPLPDPQLGSDTTMCFFKPATITPKCAFDSLIWSDGSKANTFTYDKPGDYWVKVYQGRCSNNDTLKVVLSPYSPPFNLNHDTGFCKGGSVIYDLSCVNCSYLWDDLSTIPVKIFKKGGQHTITIDNQVCKRTDTIHLIEVIAVSVFPNDTFLCVGKSITLTNPISGSTSLWNDYSTASNKTITQGGTYSLTVNQKGCKFSDTIDVNIVDPNHFNVDLGPDFSTCSSDKITLDVTTYGCTNYLWSNGATTPVLKIDTSGLYKVNVTLCGVTKSDDIQVDYLDNAITLFVPNAFTPAIPDGINDVLIPGGKIHEPYEYTFSIYNKWGMKVFETNDLAKGWDGTQNGNKLPGEVYIWTIDAHSDCYSEPYYHADGNVTLLK